MGRRRPKGRRRLARVSLFVHVDVEPGPASEDGISLRFKRALDGQAGGQERLVHELPYESESGLSGRWQVRAANDANDGHDGETEPAFGGGARAILVEDSSDGVAWLVVGGRHGLLLVHPETGTRVREPYLVLSKSAAL